MKPSRNLFKALRRRFTSEEPAGREEKDNFFYPGESFAGLRDRSYAGFRDVIEKSLAMWREDPLARRIVNLTTQFSVGRGFVITADDPSSEAFLHRFWEHPLNRMDARIVEWSDELCRTGNLFIMLSSDPDGMTYVRAIPAGQIAEIVPRENDLEQPLLFRFREVSTPGDPVIQPEKTVKPACLSTPESEERMLHFAVNRPVGGQWGEPDLAPVLKWLDRYRIWLEDRVRLNHYRTAFLFTVKSSYYSESMRRERQAQLNLRPPTAGMILVTGADEEWSVIHPNLDSSDANEDGFAIKKLIAAGAGIPVSFLAEVSGPSQAENGGMEDSACRGFRQRQQTLMWITETILRHVLARAALIHRDLDPDCEIHVYGDDIAAPGLSEGGMIRGK